MVMRRSSPPGDPRANSQLSTYDRVPGTHRFADRVCQALGRERFTARQTLAQAKVDTIQLMVAQLLLIGAQRRT
jgi:hypothetical protein